MLEQARRLQNLLTKAGYKTLAAGGFVRDHLLGRDPKDIDLATTALPEQVRKILVSHDIQVIDTGLKHGTVSAIINKIPYEITTLRIDTQCLGREAEVEFVKSFEEDAKRRDFTINAMFMDLETYEVIDYVGGQEDLKKEVLRFVGIAEDRITEDYLRILRLFRFGSQLGFNIEPKAAEKAKEFLPYLTTFISTERINTEINKLIVGKGVYNILENYTELIFAIFPELLLTYKFIQNNPYHQHDVYTHTILGVDHLKQYNDPPLSLAHLFHDIAKPFCLSCEFKDGYIIDHFYDHEHHGAKVVQRICHRLKFSSEDSKKISFLVENHMKLHFLESNKAIRKLIQECALAGDKSWIWDLYRILEADIAGQVKDNPDHLTRVFSLIKENFQIFNKPKIESPLNGYEIMFMFSIPKGSLIGQIKDHLITKIIEGNLDPSDKETAKSLAQIFIQENSG